MLSKPNILIPTDFSHHSDLAIKAGEHIRKLTGGTIKLVHISNFPPVWDWLTSDLQSEYFPEHFKKGLFTTLDKNMREQITKCDVKCKDEIIFGNAYEELHRVIKEMKPDLVIMGHKGQSGLMHIGGFTQKMVASSDVPVLVVNHSREMKEIAGLVDPSALSDKAISTAEEMSFLLSAELQVITIMPDIPSMSFGLEPFATSALVFSEEEKMTITTGLTRRITEKLDPHSKTGVKVIITKKRISDEIISTLENEKIDLAIMARHNRGRVEKFLVGSVTQRILDQFEGNLLILPE